MIRHILTAFCFFFLLSNNSFACTQIPSVWKTIDTTSCASESLSIYALTEAFINFREKSDKEFRANKIAARPFVFRTILKNDTDLVSEAEYTIVKESVDLIFKDYDILPYNQMVNFYNNGVIDNASFSHNFYVDISISSPKIENISFVDLNPHIWALLKFLRRDSVKVYTRISNPEDDIAIFLDEFEVSPTIAIETALTPNGCFIIKLEKNNYDSVVVDWGSDDGESEHVLRETHAFVDIPEIPPIGDFASDISIEISNAMKNSDACDQVVNAIKAKDVELLNVVLDTYPDFDINTLDKQGKAPVHYAASCGSIEILKRIIEKKANVNILSYDNNTALHEAVKVNDVTEQICELLLENGADLSIINNSGQTPLDIAKNQNVDLFNFLSSKK